MPALALTDHGVMYGIVEFYQKCTEAGIKPIIGVETYLARNGLDKKRARIDEKPHHLILLAKNYAGYQNLLKIVTKAHLEGFYYKPRIDLEYLESHSEGLIGTSACLGGEIPRSIINKSDKETKKLIEKYQQIFKGDFYLEVMDNQSMPEQEVVNNKIFELSKELGIDVIATNDVHYVNKDDAEAQETLLCIQMKKTLDDPNRLSMINDDWSFRPQSEMEERWKDHPEVISNTKKIADKCEVEIPLGETQLPHFELPKGMTAEKYLGELCQKGLKKRYPKITDEIKKRLKYELSVINKTGFASYFLIVQDFVNWAKDQGIIVGPGRGSAAGSIVAYLTNVTNIDPLKYNLLFERFLNPERISMPDIDMDFADTRRDEVIRYIEEKFGKDHVAQIITFGTMAARASIRDVGRVMGVPYSYCDKVAKMIPMFTTLEKALQIVPEFKEIYEKDEEGKKLINLARKIEGAARHHSVHACGLVITKDPLYKYMPVQYAATDDPTIISQYSLHPIEDLGLLKIDLLGLKNLTIIEHALYIIKAVSNVDIDIDNIPLDDAKTFKLLQDGLTTGVFQLESSGMRKYLKELRPTELDDIIAMVALYRPGPMDWIPDYIAGKNGRKKPNYQHPTLEPILKNTYGVAVYQEQVMQIARDLAGFTLGEADVLRKAMGKKIHKLIMEQREKFIEGCVKNNVTEDIAKKVFEFIEPFAGYGFNKSHAACYGMIAYQTAYLKANYPGHFMASLMTSDYGNLDRIAIEVDEAKRMGIEILPPDVNESFSKFTIVAESLKTETPRIRFGLAAIKNVGSDICRAIIDERKKNGKYKDLEDFLRRVQTKNLNKKSLENLTKGGAMDSFGIDRAVILHNMEQLLKYSKTIFNETASGQSNLFSNSPAISISSIRLQQTEAVDKKQSLAWEKELLGLYISDHPLSEHQEAINSHSMPFAKLNINNHTAIQSICIINKIKKIYTKTNEPMLFVMAEDLTKEMELIVFPKILADDPELWQEDKTMIIAGKLSDKDGEIKIIVEKAKEFSQKNLAKIKPTAGNNNIPKNILINIPPKTSSAQFEELKKLFNRSVGKSNVFLVIKNKKVLTSAKINLTKELVQDIERIISPGCVRIDNNS